MTGIRSVRLPYALAWLALLPCRLDADGVATPSRQPVRAELPPGVEQRLGIVYATTGDRDLRLDLFLPPRPAEPLPAVIVVHGGGWVAGDRTRFHALAQALAARGYAAAAIEYRLAPEARFPAAIHDVNAAIRYLRAEAERLGIDPGRIAAVGGSAGGHLVGLAAAAPHLPELQGDGGHAGVSSRLQAAVVMAGPFELDGGPLAEKSRTDRDSNVNRWFGRTVDEAPDAYRLASPLTHLSRDTPPILFQVGEHDRPERNLAARRRLRELGVPTELRVYADGDHGCWNREGWFMPMVDDIDAFLRRSLGAAPAAAGWPVWNAAGVRARRQGGTLLLEVQGMDRPGVVSIPRLGCPVGAVTLVGAAADVRSLDLRPGVDRWEILVPPGATPPFSVAIEVCDTVSIPGTSRQLTAAESRSSALPWSSPPVLVPGPDGGYHLPAHAARTLGGMLRYEPQPRKNTLGYWIRPEDRAEWLVYAEEPGRFRTVVALGCGPGQGGSDVELQVGGQAIAWTVPETGGFQSFEPVEVGDIRLAAGVNRIVIAPVRRQAKAVMDVRMVSLRPVP
jgi:acetyl esterase/lipase